MLKDRQLNIFMKRNHGCNFFLVLRGDIHMISCAFCGAAQCCKIHPMHTIWFSTLHICSAQPNLDTGKLQHEKKCAKKRVQCTW